MPNKWNEENVEPPVQPMIATYTRNADVDDDDAPLVTSRLPTPDQADIDVTSPLPKVS
jgi:hypothetical protein